MGAPPEHVRDARWSTCNHAVIVACHAVFKGGAACPVESIASDSNWTLLPFQKGEPQFYLDHIRSAVEVTRSDKHALLIFSGGRTRSEAGPISEAQGYVDAATALGLLGQDVCDRVVVEEFARDSFDNCLFGIARFAQCTRRLSLRTKFTVTMVSWQFKEKRFLHHMRTLNIPREQFSFLGVGVPKDLDAALAGEVKTLELFEADASGYGNVLGAKKLARNPFNDVHDYKQTVPCMAQILDYKDKEPASESICPWGIAEYSL